MLLTMVAILALASAYFEVKLAKAIPLWHTLSMRYVWFNLGGSILLSYALGVMFGATGLVALMAGIVSTIITIPYYKWLNFSAARAVQIAQAKQTAKDTAAMAYGTARVVSSPVRGIRKCKSAYRKVRSHA